MVVTTGDFYLGWSLQQEVVAFRPSYDWVRNMSVKSAASRHSSKVSLVFNNLQPQALAEILTYLEYKAFRRITVSTQGGEGGSQ